MKQILLMFGSIAATLLGLVLLYANLSAGYGIGYYIGDALGILILAAGLTGIWTLRRNRQS
jgi:hypothetical protein